MAIDKNTKLGVWIFLIVLVLILVSLCINTHYENRIIHEPHTVVCVHIDNIDYSQKFGASIDFEYYYNGVCYNHHRTGIFKIVIFNDVNIDKESYRQYKYEGRSDLLIVILNDKPDIFYVVENSADFEKYNISSTDTTGLTNEKLIFSNNSNNSIN